MASSNARASDAIDRRLDWDGGFNVRDLGGFETADGRRTRFGAVVRSDARERLTQTGWTALQNYGVTTIIDLRVRGEYEHGSAVPAGVELVELPAIDLLDEEFWGDGRWRGKAQTTEFYRAALERWPERFADAVSAVAHAGPGGVLFHCQAGRDRAGIVAAAVLSLVGVSNSAIAADYAQSAGFLQPLYDGWIAAADDEREQERIRRANTSDDGVMFELLQTLDLPAHLLAHGVTRDDLARLRTRLVDG